MGNTQGCQVQLSSKAAEAAQFVIFIFHHNSFVIEFWRQLIFHPAKTMLFTFTSGPHVNFHAQWQWYAYIFGWLTTTLLPDSRLCQDYVAVHEASRFVSVCKTCEAYIYTFIYVACAVLQSILNLNFVLSYPFLILKYGACYMTTHGTAVNTDCRYSCKS